MDQLKQLVHQELENVRNQKLKQSHFFKSISSIISICLPAIIIFILVKGVFGLSFVQGDSMLNTLHTGDFVIFNRLDKNIHYQDIIVAKKHNEDKIIIKRVIGLPNDTVDIIDGYVYVNGIKLEESSYILGTITPIHDRQFPITLSANEYFVLGDNRLNSLDSRDNKTGNILKEDIIGKVFFISRVYKSQ